jgi:recombination protein RecA
MPRKAKSKTNPNRKPKGSPVRVRNPFRRDKVKSAPKIKKDLVKEYTEAIKTEGVVKVLNLADTDCLSNVKSYISTQSLELDKLLNGLGIPTGRVTEIYGPPHIGKSTLLDHLFASVQKKGGIGILADTEGARDSRYSRSIGVDLEALCYLEFERTELYIENIITRIYQTVEFWHEKAPDLPVVIGWDALGGTATKDELEKRLEKDSRVAGAAQILRTACRQLPTKLGNTNIAVVICNHEYENINTTKFGKKRETYGGAAVRHLASIRLQLYNLGYIKTTGGEIVGRETGAKLVKNRLGRAWKETSFALLSGIGIDNLWSIFTRLSEAKIIEKKGSWSAINLDGEIIKFQGWTGLQEKCVEDETLFPRLTAVYLSLA